MIPVKIYGFLKSKSTAIGRKTIEDLESIIAVIRVFFLVLNKLYNFFVKICNTCAAVGNVDIIAMKKGFELKYNARFIITNPWVLKYIPLKNIPSNIEKVLVLLTTVSFKTAHLLYLDSNARLPNAKLPIKPEFSSKPGYTM